MDHATTLASMAPPSTAPKFSPETPLHSVPAAAADGVTESAYTKPAATTVAEKFREIRNQRGLSLEEASRKSNVPLRYARMLEEGQYSAVVDPAYLVYFVRRYAEWLGVDPARASRQFIAETEDRPRHPARPEPTGRRPESSARVAGAARRTRPRPRLFNYYAGPLTIIAAAWLVGPLSPLNLSAEKVPARRSSVERLAGKPETPRVDSAAEPPIAAAPPALADGRALPAAEKPAPTAETVAPEPPVAAPAAPALSPVADVASAEPSRSPDTVARAAASPAEASQVAARKPPRVDNRAPSARKRTKTDSASDALRREQIARIRARLVHHP